MTLATASSTATEMAALQALGVELIARDRWSRPQLLAFQRRRLAELVAHAVARQQHQTFAVAIQPAVLRRRRK